LAESWAGLVASTGSGQAMAAAGYWVTPGLKAVTHAFGYQDLGALSQVNGDGLSRDGKPGHASR
jgi:hypothetical protein